MIDFNREIFRATLKQAIKRAGGYKAVSSSSGVNTNTISKWVSGDNVPTVDKLHSIAQACEISIEELITGKKPSSPVQTNEVERVVEEAGRIASLVATAVNKSGKFDYEPNEFGSTFMSLLKHSLDEVANKEEMGVIIDFEMKKKSIR